MQIYEKKEKSVKSLNKLMPAIIGIYFIRIVCVSTRIKKTARFLEYVCALLRENSFKLIKL